MAYRLILKPSAEKALLVLPRSDMVRIDAALRNLAENPLPSAAKLLHAKERIHRIRVGHYRILYRVDTDPLVVLVLAIGHRREIYRRLP